MSYAPERLAHVRIPNGATLQWRRLHAKQVRIEQSRQLERGGDTEGKTRERY